jgi:predicted deacetylase
VVLHDVAPARWAGCTRVLQRVHAVAQAAGIELPVTLLVVPRMHGQAAASTLYLRWLHRLARAGHELALHGFTHRDEGPAPRSWRERLLRHSYTAGEGEFAALTRDDAALRLAAGRAWAQQHGLQMRGFVAPAWLLNAAAWQAVSQAAFDYTCTLNEIVALPGHQTLRARSLVFSTRAAWRRWLSVPWNTALAWQQRNAPLLRLELHPGDSDHPLIERCWTRLLASALRARQPLSLHDAAMLARQTAPQGVGT